MMNECFGCYYSKENVCTHGSPIFIDDTCTDYQDNEFVKQIRVDERANTVEDCKEVVLQHWINGTVARRITEEICGDLEQLKEQKNES